MVSIIVAAYLVYKYMQSRNTNKGMMMHMSQSTELQLMRILKILYVDEY